MKQFNLKRTYFKDATLGHLWEEDDEKAVWPTIELPWLDNETNVSCIPEGTYVVKPWESEKFKKYPNVWLVEGVLNREQILIHVANLTSELKGCIAPGLASGYMLDNGVNVKAVTNSTLAMREIKKATTYPEPFELKIWS